MFKQPASFLFLTLAAAVAGNAQTTTTIVTGLSAPMRLVMTTGGNFLVTETSSKAFEGRVTRVSRGGSKQTVLDGLPSGVEVTGGGSGPTAMALRERILYVAIGGGEMERSGAEPGTSVPNASTSSPLFCSILKFTFNQDVDTLTAGFTLQAADHFRLADGLTVDLDNGAGARATAEALTMFRPFVPDPNVMNRFSNPFGLALRGDTLYVADASYNKLVQIDVRTGRAKTLLSFRPLPNPAFPFGPPVVDAVPDSVRVYGDKLLVSFLTGFPFNEGLSNVVLIDPVTGASEPFINGLTSAVDIAWRTNKAGLEQFFVLEFSGNQLASAPGRLVLYDSPERKVQLDQLIAPTSIVSDPATGDLYILEITGRISQVQIP